MVLVLILFGLMIFIMLLFLFILSLTIKINIDYIKFEKHKNNVNKDAKIILDVYFLNKIKIIRIKLNDKRIKKIKNKYNQKNEKILAKKSEIKEILKYVIKNKKINISKLNLNIKIGLIDGIITSISVATISTIIAILLPNLVNKHNENNISYKITPIYKDEITLKIDLSCIFEVKLVHIIYMIYVLLKKVRVNNNERTSNRRTYAYSYE